MSIETDIFDYVVDLMGVPTSPSLQTEKSFAVQLATMRTDTVFYDLSSTQTMSLLVLGKDTDQKTLANAMFEICDKISFNQNEDLKIHNINIATPPSYVCLEDGYYTWTCIVDVEFTKGN
ncbi:MAG: hypothetical protein R3Y33_04505 [Clostridia bacterium]